PVVGDDRVHIVRLAERGWMRVADTPGQSATRDGVMLAIDDVADPSDGFAERDADDRDVEHESDRKTKPSRGYESGDGRPDRRAGRSDAAVPERDELERAVGIDAPVVGGMRAPSLAIIGIAAARTRTAMVWSWRRPNA